MRLTAFRGGSGGQCDCAVVLAVNISEGFPW